MAQRGGPPEGFKRGPFMGRMARVLNLTDEQREQISKIHAAEREIMKPVYEQMREIRQALDEATKDGQFNEAEVTRLAEKQGELLAQTIVSRERVHAQIWQILTPEQREKMAQFRDKRHERMRPGAGVDGPPMGRRRAF
jgi:protein CpxP